jgi:hypothetical protein
MAMYSDFLKQGAAEAEQIKDHLFALLGADREVANHLDSEGLAALRSAIEGVAEFSATMAWACASPGEDLATVYNAARDVVTAFFARSAGSPLLPLPWVLPSGCPSQSISHAVQRLGKELDDYRACFSIGKFELNSRSFIIWLWAMVGRSYLLLAELARETPAVQL